MSQRASQDWLILKENIQEGPAMSHVGDERVKKRNLAPTVTDEDVAWGMRVLSLCSELCRGLLAPVQGEN